MKPKTSKTRSVGDIGNYYGSLHIKKDKDRFFWSIENYDGHSWSEIPQSLFDVLNKYEDERTAGKA